MKINNDKSKVVHFRKQNSAQTLFNFKCSRKDLDIVREYKYLGITLDEHLKFDPGTKVLGESGGRALSAVISKFKTLKDISYNTFTKLFDSCVASVTDYASGIWSYCKSDAADRIQNKAARYFLGVHRFTPIAALQGEMGWKPTKVRHKIKVLQLWNRINKMPNNRLTKHIFNYFYENNNGRNWFSNVKDILKVTGINAYHDKTICDLNICEVKLFDHWKTEWIKNVNKKAKLRSYKLFKNSYKAEDYVLSFLPKYKRSLLAKFRCGILQLRIESGRYVNLKVDDRICQMCSLHNVEDEIHFLCTCPFYVDIRKKLYTLVSKKDAAFVDYDIETKFVILLQNFNFLVSNFIYEAWEKRKKALYN